MDNFSFILGIIGNVISILMFAAPIKTFKRIINKKSTEDFKGIPYITTLLSTSLWTFYGLLKPGGLLVVTVNGSGAFLHIIYVTLFLIYAPKSLKIQSIKLVAIIDIAFLGVVIAITLLAVHGTTGLTLVGLLCAGLNVGMYASPLAATKTVIKMKSVEYMPFFLSFFQFLNGGVWTGYAVLVKDYYIGVPNGIGFILGAAQLILYFIYYKSTPTQSTEENEEKGSSNVVTRGIQMKDIDEAHENGNSGNLQKGKSLPKPYLVRQYSEKLVKTLCPSSLSSNNEDDVEKGLKDAH